VELGVFCDKIVFFSKKIENTNIIKYLHQRIFGLRSHHILSEAPIDCWGYIHKMFLKVTIIMVNISTA